jgi:hypothetical protein
MTNVASKHGLRAAATERRTKHAQRTMLPPKATRDAIREANVVELIAESPSARYGMMTVAELKVEAKSLGLVTYTLRTKGALLNAILARLQESPKREALAEAKVDATFSGPQPGDEIEIPTLAIADDSDADFLNTDTGDDEPAQGGEQKATGPAEVEEERLDSRSGKKANTFADKAEALGWTATLRDSQASEDRVTCVAKRDAEVISIEWLDGVFDNQTCFHTTPGGRALKLRNASHALKRMALAPVDVVREDAKVGIHRATRPAVGSGASGSPTPRTAYFAEDVSDEEVLASVAGKTITWVNAISGALESDQVKGEALIKSRTLQHRALHFLGSNGFRAVRVSAIVSL